LSKRQKFQHLAEMAARCRKCERMRGRRAVLSENNGSIDSQMMFIAEAPGRFGGDRTLIPLLGDRSGDNFQLLIDSAGLKRDEIFVTNAVLCNPRTPGGCNARPLQSEIDNCREFLIRQIELIEPRVVVTLGAVALSALNRIERCRTELSEAVGQAQEWNGRKLVALYHPSPRVCNSQRKIEQQKIDYQAVKRALES